MRLNYATKSCWTCWAAIFTLMSFLLSGAAYAAPVYDNIASLDRLLPPLDRAKMVGSSFRCLSCTFEEQFNITEAVQQESQTQHDADNEKVPSLGAYGKEFFPDLVGGTKRIFSRDNLTITLIGLGLTGLAFTLDHTVKDYFQEQQPIGHVSHYGDSAGQGYVPFALGASLFAAGEVFDNKQLADTGIVSIEALAVTGITTEALKYATGRLRPNHQDNMSFPAGHASMTAAFAASVSGMYDWNPYVAVPLFTVVTFVGASRIQDNMHYLSDVIAGITLGTIVGMSFAKYQLEKNSENKIENNFWNTMAISPVFDKDLKGFAFTFKW